MQEAACACGQLRLEVTGTPLRISVCHCSECRRRTGSAFSHNARFERAKVRMMGEDRVHTRLGDEGSRIRYHFCGDCGVTVWYENSALPDLIAVPVGAFAPVDPPPPGWSVYEERRPGWLRLEVDNLEVIP